MGNSQLLCFLSYYNLKKNRSFSQRFMWGIVIVLLLLLKVVSASINFYFQSFLWNRTLQISYMNGPWYYINLWICFIQKFNMAARPNILFDWLKFNGKNVLLRNRNWVRMFLTWPTNKFFCQSEIQDGCHHRIKFYDRTLWENILNVSSMKPLELSGSKFRWITSWVQKFGYQTIVLCVNW